MKNVLERLETNQLFQEQTSYMERRRRVWLNVIVMQNDASRAWHIGLG